MKVAFRYDRAAQKTEAPRELWHFEEDEFSVAEQKV